MSARKRSSASRKRGMKLAGIFFIGALIISAVILIIFSLIFAAVLYLPSLNLPLSYSISVGGVNDRPRNYSSYSLKYGDAVHGDEEYIDFSMLAEKCTFPVTGDGKTLKYKLTAADGSLGSMIIDPEGSCITVSGTSVPIKNGIYIKNGTVLIPCSFVENYINGITVEKDGRNIKLVLEDEITLAVCTDSGNDAVDISDI